MQKETLKTTMHSRVYKMLYYDKIAQEEGLCPICSPNKGCNYWKNHDNDTKCWKTSRKKQYK